MTERIIAQRLGIGLPQVQGTVRLLREGATIPFISRYRKEATGSLDELQVGAIKNNWTGSPSWKPAGRPS